MNNISQFPSPLPRDRGDGLYDLELFHRMREEARRDVTVEYYQDGVQDGQRGGVILGVIYGVVLSAPVWLALAYWWRR